MKVINVNRAGGTITMGDVVVKVKRVTPGYFRLAIDAPPEVRIGWAEGEDDADRLRDLEAELDEERTRRERVEAQLKLIVDQDTKRRQTG